MSPTALCKIVKTLSMRKNEPGLPLARRERGMLYFVMAICWILLGAVLLAWQWWNPAVFSAFIWGTRIPLGWLGIAVGLYDLLRWWLSRSSRKLARPGREEAHPRRPSGSS